MKIAQNIFLSVIAFSILTACNQTNKTEEKENEQIKEDVLQKLENESLNEFVQKNLPDEFDLKETIVTDLGEYRDAAIAIGFKEKNTIYYSVTAFLPNGKERYEKKHLIDELICDVDFSNIAKLHLGETKAQDIDGDGQMELLVEFIIEGSTGIQSDGERKMTTTSCWSVLNVEDDKISRNSYYEETLNAEEAIKNERKMALNEKVNKVLDKTYIEVEIIDGEHYCCSCGGIMATLKRNPNGEFYLNYNELFNEQKIRVTPSIGKFDQLIISWETEEGEEVSAEYAAAGAYELLIFNNDRTCAIESDLVHMPENPEECGI